MRALLVVAAAILSITGAQAQQTAGETPAVAQEPVTRAVPPSQALEKATPSLVDQLKAAGELKNDPKPAEAKPAELPVVAKPVDAKPADAKATETKAVETKPGQPRPVRASEAKPAKRVVKRRETDEQKARRIAAKYGVYW